MKLTINLTWDAVSYDKIKMEGCLAESIMGYDNFKITEYDSGDTEIEFWDDVDGLVWTYDCYFTDHGHLLHVIIGEEK